VPFFVLLLVGGDVKVYDILRAVLLLVGGDVLCSLATWR